MSSRFAMLEKCLAHGDAIFTKGHLVESDLDVFHDYNVQFHDIITRASGNPAIEAMLSRNNHLPFASATALALNLEDYDAEFAHLQAAHDQHHAVVRAIQSQDVERAESIMRDHARMAIASAGIFERLGIMAYPVQPHAGG